VTARGLTVASALALAMAMAIGHAEPLTPDRARVIEQEIDQLARHVADHADDVDARLALASRLAWIDRREDARREAGEVVRRAPDYVDAYLLLARLAAWDRDYTGAHRWLDVLAARRPLDRAALLVRADLYLWQAKLDEARGILESIADPDTEVLLRLARVELAANNTWRAHSLAGAILATDPGHPLARGIFDDTRRFRVGLDSYVGRYPVADPARRLAAGVMATLVVFPRARLSVTGQYELDHRFATENHRVSARADWRPTTTWTTTVYARAGWVQVVPAATVYGALQWEPRVGDYLGGRYTFDEMTWPGRLHRVTLTGGIGLGHDVRVDAAASGGVLAYCGTSSLVRALEVQLGYVRPRWQIGVKYAHGIELDRPALPAFLQGMYGDDVCPADMAELDLQAIETDDVSLLPVVQLGRRSSAGITYTYQRRHDSSSVHIAGLMLRRTF